MVIYLVILLLLILFTTWIQGLVYGACTRVDNAFIHGIARLIATGVAGMIQFIIIFPLEKFWLLKEKKTDAPADGAEVAEVADVAEEAPVAEVAEAATAPAVEATEDEDVI